MRAKESARGGEERRRRARAVERATKGDSDEVERERRGERVSFEPYCARQRAGRGWTHRPVAVRKAKPADVSEPEPCDAAQRRSSRIVAVPAAVPSPAVDRAPRRAAELPAGKGDAGARDGARCAAAVPERRGRVPWRPAPRACCSAGKERGRATGQLMASWSWSEAEEDERTGATPSRRPARRTAAARPPAARAAAASSSTTTADTCELLPPSVAACQAVKASSSTELWEERTHLCASRGGA